MTQVQLLNEFRQLSLPQQMEVIQEAMQILSEHFQMMESRANGGAKQGTLVEAAALLLADYTEDQELTSFTILDGKLFYAER